MWQINFPSEKNLPQQKVVVWPQLRGGQGGGDLDFVVRTTQNYHFFEVTSNIPRLNDHINVLHITFNLSKKQVLQGARARRSASETF